MAGLWNAIKLLLTFLTLAFAVSPPKTDYDVIIVGGGPSGLSAQSALCRVSRTSILFDHGKYRNAPTRNMHDVIGNDGQSHIPQPNETWTAYHNTEVHTKIYDFVCRNRAC